MIIQIEHHAPVPIYEQLVQELEKLIESGELKEHDPLPSIRQLASQLDVAINTVARAYQELERKGTIVSNGRKGTFVRRTTSHRTHNRDFKELIIHMLRQGLSKEEISQLFNQSLHQIFN
jgi:GntR family transcriptional regulator